MTDLTALAARVEREAPSRDLDAAIARALGWRQRDDFPNRWRSPDRQFAPLPEFTSSIDAAVAIVPAGISWGVGSMLSTFSLVAESEHYGSAGNDESWTKSTPAAALAAASLRARAAMMDKADEA